MKIGILSLQGDIEEHEYLLIQAAKELKTPIEIVRVKTPQDLQGIKGLILPGGESTTMKAIGKRSGIFESLKTGLLNKDFKIFGTCAGTILLAENVKRKPDAPATPGVLGVSKITVLRNAYGRQNESFETTLEAQGIGSINVAFIRAPVVEEYDQNTERVLATFNGKPVLLENEYGLVATFHPEITMDTSLHKYFLEHL